MSETISVHNIFSQGLSLEFSCIEPVTQWTNLSSYCGLVDAKIRASDKDLPVPGSTNKINSEYGFVVQVVYCKNLSFMRASIDPKAEI